MKKLMSVFTCVLVSSLPLAAADAAAGKAAYTKACKSCHEKAELNLVSPRTRSSIHPTRMESRFFSRASRSSRK